MKRTLSLLMTVVLLVLAVVAAVPSAFASAVEVADSGYSLATPSFKVERGAKGILVTWNADSGVDHYRVYHKTADGWSKVADNIKVGYYLLPISTVTVFLLPLRPILTNTYWVIPTWTEW